MFVSSYAENFCSKVERLLVMKHLQKKATDISFVGRLPTDGIDLPTERPAVESRQADEVHREAQ